MAGVHSRFAAITEAEILQIQEDAVPDMLMIQVSRVNE